MKYALLFRVNDLLLAMDVQFVSLILRQINITPLPGSPDHIEGVFVYQENVVAVINMAIKYGNLTENKGRDRVFLTKISDMTVALHVDEVLDVVTINKDDLTKKRKKGVPALGVFVRDNQPIALIDPDQILSEKEKKVLRAIH